MIRKCVSIVLLAVTSLASAGEPAADGVDPAVRNQVLRALRHIDDRRGADRIFAQYGDAAIAVVREVLASPHSFDSLEVSRAISRMARSSAADKRFSFQVILTGDQAEWRREVVQAYADNFADASDTPVFVSLLYDPNLSVQYAAIEGLGRIADSENALHAIAVWRARAKEADADRDEIKRWLRPSVGKKLSEAENAIRQRIKAKPEKGK